MHVLQPSELTDRVFGDRYRVIGQVGSGAHAEVCVAEDLKRPRRVALKVFNQSIGQDPDIGDRILEAVEQVASVSHLNLARIYAWGRDGVRVWIASELCLGGSLKGLLSHSERLSPSQALVMTLEAARALAHLHDAGLVHGAVKPANVLFSAEQRLLISDTGLAEVLAEAPLSSADRAIELVRHTSPEQAAGLGSSAASDVYSLALTVDEAVSGAGPTELDTLTATRNLRTTTVPELHPELAGLRPSLERCVRLDPGERPEAEELTIAVLAAAETMARPGPLPLVGVQGLDIDAPYEATEAQIDVTIDPTDEDLPLDMPDFSVEPGELIVVPDIPEPVERVALEDLSTAEPSFAAEQPDEPALDVPVGSVPGGTGTVFRVDPDDLDDHLPSWPLIVLGVLVAAAIAAWVLLGAVGGTQSEAVPDLVGADLATVDSAVASGGWELKQLEIRQNGTTAGIAVAQDPPPGIELEAGETLTMTFSLGPEMVEIPDDLPGLTLAQAQARLADADLIVGAVTQENSEVVDSGLVIEIDEPTRQKPAGEAVSLRVSVGPEERVVPDVIGIPISDATTRLVAQRLQAEAEQVYHPDAEVGTVLASIPAAGQAVPADSQVTVQVSAGPEPVVMPDVSDLSLGEAVDIIESFGLILLDTVGSPGEPVIGTLPPAGEVVDVGTEITIVLDEASEDDEEADDEDAEG